mmetsp:Transcript_24575/g.21811  ORF Transcript_24575/g.21811 Transcript_24575/m.21811 type:complete len:154 (+) Transcript_24575:618-1079(+)
MDSSSLSDPSSNTNTNQDQGSVTDISQKMSISSNKHSKKKGSSFTPSDQSKISAKIKENCVKTHSNDDTSNNNTSSNLILPYFAKPEDNNSVTDNNSGEQYFDQTSQSVSGLQRKYDSVLNIQAQISERKDDDSPFNPFKAAYRQSKTSEDLR